MAFPSELVPQPGEYRCELPYGDLTRSYRAIIPDSVTTQRKWPLLIALHGSGTHAGTMEAFTGLSEFAAQEGFAVVYPNGTGRSRTTLSWNVRGFNSHAAKQQVDDLGYLQKLLDHLQETLPIDPGQVFVTGFSNGAMMAYSLACSIADRISAIGPVAGPMLRTMESPSRPVPICHIHGTHDDFAPLEGGIGKKSLSKTKFPPLSETLTAWAQVNQCQTPPTVETFPPAYPDGTHIVRHIYHSPDPHGQIQFYEVVGGGHTWPGKQSIFTILGKSTQNLDANRVLWQFFQQHRRG